MSFELHKHTKTHKSSSGNQFKILHNKKFIKNIDKWVMFIGILSPLTSLPQIFEIIERQNADGVSALTWLLYIILALFWVLYGLVHKEKVIIVNNLLWIAFELVIVFLTFIY